MFLHRVHNFSTQRHETKFTCTGVTVETNGYDANGLFNILVSVRDPAPDTRSIFCWLREPCPQETRCNCTSRLGLTSKSDGIQLAKGDEADSYKSADLYESAKMVTYWTQVGLPGVVRVWKCSISCHFLSWNSPSTASVCIVSLNFQLLKALSVCFDLPWI